MFATATWEGVSGFLEKIKGTCCGVTRVMVCCDSEEECGASVRHHTVLLHSEYVADCIVCTCALSAPQTYLLSLLLFFLSAELILQTVQKSLLK